MKGLVFGLLISLAAACSPPRGWIPKTTEELVPKYPLILLATLKEGEPRSPSLVGGKKIYDVFCILKGDYRPFPAMITLEDPVNPCVSIPNNAGQSFILGLSRVNDTAFTWWKDAGLETVIHEYTKKKSGYLYETLRYAKAIPARRSTDRHVPRQQNMPRGTRMP